MQKDQTDFLRWRYVYSRGTLYFDLITPEKLKYLIKLKL